MGNWGFWVDLATVKLDDNNVSTIQAMPLGKYEHPVHGTIEFTPDRIKRFADNVNNKVRGTELDIDYDHKAQTMKAAGWVKGATDAGPQGLMLSVEWTEDAARAIRAKEYRYFSPEFADEWTHPKTSQKFQDVLFGGALTNRPFLKDILPVNLSELFSDDQPSGGPMDPKELRQLLGLPETASDDDVRAKLEASNPSPTDPNPGDPNPPAPAPQPQPAPQPTNPPQPTPEPEPAPTPEQLAELLKFPAFKAFHDQMQAMTVRLDEQDKRLREQDIRAQLAGLSDSSMALPPSVENDLVAALSDPSGKVDMAKLFGAVATLKKTGFVRLDESGRSGQQGGSNAEGFEAFDRAVRALMEKDPKLSYPDAADQVALQDPKLYEAYRSASYSFREA